MQQRTQRRSPTPFQFDRPLVFIDLETTGTNVKHDRIVELGLVRITPEGEVTEKVRRINPEVPIPATATKVHGIADEDVADEPTFRRIAKSLYGDFLAGADLAGFNVRRFDLPLLVAEFERSDIELDPKAMRVVDAQTIYHAMERRDLSAAVRFYLDDDHGEAHSALADAKATAAVLKAQLERYEELPREIDSLHAFCDGFAPIRTPAAEWFRGEGDDRTFRKGKHYGKKLSEVVRSDRDYLADWMLLKAENMHEEVLAIVRHALKDS